MKKLIALWMLLFPALACAQFSSRTAARIRPGDPVPAACTTLNGDVFFKNAGGTEGIYQCIGNVYVQVGTGTVTGSGAADRIAFWTTASNISSDANFNWTKTGLGGDGTQPGLFARTTTSGTFPAIVAEGELGVTPTFAAAQAVIRTTTSNGNQARLSFSEGFDMKSIIFSGRITGVNDGYLAVGLRNGATTLTESARFFPVGISVGQATAVSRLYLKGSADGNSFMRIDSAGGSPQYVAGAEDTGGTTFSGSFTNVAHRIRMNNVAQWQFDTTGVFLPLNNNTQDLGTTSFRWRTGYFGTSVGINQAVTPTARLHVIDTAGGTNPAVRVNSQIVAAVACGNICLENSGASGVGIGAHNTGTFITTFSRDFGANTAGPTIRAGRNNNATPAAGTVNLVNRNDTNGYLWQDANQALRLSITAPTTAASDTGDASMAMALEGVMFTATATATVANTTTETTLVGSGLGTATIPASYLQIGKTYRITARGIYSTIATPGTLNIRVRYGGIAGTVLGTTGAITAPASVTNLFWEASFDFTCRTTGATGTVFGQGRFDTQQDTSTRGAFLWGMVNTATVTIDTTAASALVLSAQWGTADAGNTISATNLSIEALN